MNRPWWRRLIAWLLDEAGAEAEAQAEHRRKKAAPRVEARPLPITDSLDLHTFKPREAGPLTDAYLWEAHAKGFRRVRVIHGKGKGVMRRTIHTHLNRHPLVQSIERPAGHEGGWGATWALLREVPKGQPPGNGRRSAENNGLKGKESARREEAERRGKAERREERARDEGESTH